MLNLFGVSITSTGWHDWGQVLTSNRITLDLTKVFIAGDGFLSGPPSAVPMLLDSMNEISAFVMDRTPETGAGRLLVTGDTDMFTNQYIPQYAENVRFADGMAAWAIGPFSTLSGHVALVQYLADPSSVSVPLKLYRNGALADVLTVQPDATGAYSASVLALGACDGVAKPSHWLAVTQSLDTSQASTADWGFDHNGDADGSNKIGIADLSVILLNFGAQGASDGDMDGDGSTGLPDLSIVLLNFGLTGATGP